MSSVLEPVTADPPDWDRRPVLRQTWAELAYFHWPYDPAVVQRRLPRDVAVDVFDGAAWVGLIPFEMRDVRVYSLGAPSVLGNFIEINVRTYVTDPRGRRAVWFFSLDVPRSLIVAVARSVFALPYRWANATHSVRGDHHHFHMRRRQLRGAGPEADIAFTVGDRLDDGRIGEFENFLTARWALLTRRRERLLYGRVHHPRWPLHRVDECRIDQDVIEAAGLPSPEGAPHALYSPGVDVEIAWLERLTAERGR